MAVTVRFKLYRKGVRQLLTSPEAEQETRRRAERIAAAAGPGHKVVSERSGNRARAAVVTTDFEAMRAEAKTRRLSASIDAARV